MASKAQLCKTGTEISLPMSAWSGCKFPLSVWSPGKPILNKIWQYCRHYLFIYYYFYYYYYSRIIVHAFPNALSPIITLRGCSILFDRGSRCFNIIYCSVHCVFIGTSQFIWHYIISVGHTLWCSLSIVFPAFINRNKEQLPTYWKFTLLKSSIPFHIQSEFYIIHYRVYCV